MQPPYPSWAEDLGHGVHAVDTGFHRPRFDAAYLIVEGGRAAFVDTGTNDAVPRLLGLLDALGLARDAVDHVIPTHVHLDHAGGVGALMRELPAATLWVHARGARHLIDPSKLYAGALAVYGQAEMDRSYGTLLPVPAERVRSTADGDVITLAGRALHVADTPGHARHHHCLWDETTRGWFTGDTFGLSYREFDTALGPWILPTSTPVQFDPDAMRHSVQRLLARDPACMYLTHFGRVRDVPRLGRLLFELLDGMVAIARAAPAGADRHAAMKRQMLALYLDSLAAHGCTLDEATVADLLAIDLELNAQGLAVWLDSPAD
jgi:glyoxylase-like metal-dependent hydrolase (beta-lactamase superfamily II)